MTKVIKAVNLYKSILSFQIFTFTNLDLLFIQLLSIEPAMICQWLNNPERNKTVPADNKRIMCCFSTITCENMWMTLATYRSNDVYIWLETHVTFGVRWLVDCHFRVRVILKISETFCYQVFFSIDCKRPSYFDSVSPVWKTRVFVFC